VRLQRDHAISDGDIEHCRTWNAAVYILVKLQLTEVQGDLVMSPPETEPLISRTVLTLVLHLIVMTYPIDLISE